MKRSNFRRHLYRGAIWTLLCVIVGLAAGVSTVLAQTDQSDFIRRALQNQDGNDQNLMNGNSNQPLRSTIQTYTPAIPDASNRNLPPSRLETIYSERAGRRLEQFGYRTLGVPTAVQVGQVGAVQDSYVLGQGDEIVVALRGQENSTYRTRVDRDGQVILPKLSPIQAGGRSFGDFRADIEAAVHQAFVSTNAYVSLGEIHEVSVLVTGEVRTPGARILSALATPLDAILLSGGINKTGSLRSVELIRGGASRTIDLYGILEGGSTARLGTLRDGDRIYVPPLGKTVAIAGSVRREGIYELPHGTNAISADSLLRLAGGLEIAGEYHFSKMALGRDGNTGLISSSRGSVVHDGEVLFADARQVAALGRVTLAGAVQVRGAQPRVAADSIGHLIHATQDLRSDAYTEFAIIVRKDPRSNARVLIPFSLEQVLSGTGDVPLADDDFVYIFTDEEIKTLATAASSENTNANDNSGGNNGENDNEQRTNSNRQDTDQNGQYTDQNGQNTDQYGPNTNQYGPNTDQYGPNTSEPSEYQNSNPNSESPDTSLGPVAAAPTQSQQNPSRQSNDASAALSQTTPGGLSFDTGPDIRNVDRAPTSEAQIALGSAIAEARREGGRRSRPLVNRAETMRILTHALGVTEQALTRVAKDHLVLVLDEVRDPGAYLSAEGSTLHGMLQAAGGILREADLSWVEVTTTQIDSMSGSAHTIRTAYKGHDTDFEKVSVHPLDVIRLRPVFSDSEGGRIVVSGEVRFPGTFDILRDEHLSAIIERAGGLTDQAYPYGAVFTRRRAAIAEKAANEREAAQLESSVGGIVSRPDPNNTNKDEATYVSGLARKLRTSPALGRIVTVVDPSILHAKPELDIVVESGDTLYIPKRPTTVTVSGEVLNPGSFQYRADLALNEYMRLAGGTTQDADGSRTFTVLPDGTARPTNESWLSFGAENRIPPGSTVVVPRDLKPFDTLQFVKDMTQIVGSLAITAASVAVISK